jgi:hypothetical protein
VVSRAWALGPALAGMSVLGLAAHAATIASPAPEKVAITLYRNGDGPFQALQDWQRQQALEKGLVLVTETRTVDLPAGRHTVRFDGVAEGLIPESAAVEGLPGPAVERNYDYALLSPGTLIERSLGQPIKLVRTNRKTGRQQSVDATLLQGPDGLMVRTAEGVEALGCSGGPERLVLDRVPDGLTDRPSLSTIVDAPSPSRVKLTVSYLALGVNWQADYVARIHPDGQHLDLTGWLTLVNSGGSQFANAKTQAVAGKLSREEIEVARGEAKAIDRACWPMDTTHRGRPVARSMPYGGVTPPPPLPMPAVMARAPAVEQVIVTGMRAKLAEQSNLGDYKLYTLPEPVTLNPRQTKQVAFLDQKDVAFQRLYVVGINAWGAPDGTVLPPEVFLRLENKIANGLGKPLPSGALSAMETVDGRPTFAGEQAVRDVAVGEPVDLVIGRAMDVRARPRLVEEIRAKGRVRRTYEVDLSNAKTIPITVELRQDPNLPTFKVVAEPQSHDIRQGQVAWRLSLAPAQTRTFRYAIEYGG